MTFELRIVLTAGGHYFSHTELHWVSNIALN